MHNWLSWYFLNEIYILCHFYYQEIANVLRAILLFRTAFVCIHIISILTLTKRFKEYILFCRHQSRFRSIKRLLSSTMKESDSFKFYRKPNRSVLHKAHSVQYWRNLTRWNTTEHLTGSLLHKAYSVQYWRNLTRLNSTENLTGSILHKAHSIQYFRKLTSFLVGLLLLARKLLMWQRDLCVVV